MSAEATALVKAQVELPKGVVVVTTVRMAPVQNLPPGGLRLNELFRDIFERRTVREESTEPMTLALEVPLSARDATVVALRELAAALEKIGRAA